MSDTATVTIKEGRKDRNFSDIGRIVTQKPDGTTNWVPEGNGDNKYRILNATANGNYKSDENTYYNEVNVSVTRGLVEKEIDENGIYKASDEVYTDPVTGGKVMADGFSTVTVKTSGLGLKIYNGKAIGIGNEAINLSDYYFVVMSKDNGVTSQSKAFNMQDYDFSVNEKE